MPSYEKNKSSGLWSCRFRETDAEGIAHQKRLSGYKTKKEAQFGYEDYIKQKDEERKQKEAAKNLPPPDPNDMLFQDLLESYMNFTKNRVKESSFYDMESKIRNRLEPHFFGMTMNQITPKIISDWVEKLDYAYKSKIWIFSTLSAIYKYGHRYYNITDIMDRVDRPRNMEPPKEMEIWTPAELAQFLPCVVQIPYRLYYLTLYLTGCRRGEGAALTWNDLHGNSLRINKSITTKTKSGPYIITTPKNKGSIRTITIPTYLTQIFEMHKEEQMVEYGEEWSPDLFIFGGKRPLPTTTVDRYFANSIKIADVKKIRIHDLRHSCASLLIHKGVSIVAVSRQLGHSNVEQTLNTYSHLLPDDKTLIQNTLENLGTQLGTEF